MTSRELTNFMAEANTKKEILNDREINLKDVSIFNIRRNENGLYFNIKIYGEEEKEVNNLFIPARFYKNNPRATQANDKIVINKSKIFNIIFIYPAAILSLAVIFATIFKYLPVLQRFFNFSVIY